MCHFRLFWIMVSVSFLVLNAIVSKWLYEDYKSAPLSVETFIIKSPLSENMPAIFFCPMFDPILYKGLFDINER